MEKGLPAWLWGPIIGAIVIFIALLDWLTGYEMEFHVFYFLPVSLSAWFLGLGASLILAVVGATVWYAVDFLSGHAYPSHFYAVWNTMMHLVSFLAIGWSVHKIRYLFDHEREMAEALRRSLSETKILEAILPICAQCKKIRNEEDHWQQLEIYIGEHSNTRFSHGYCPECAKKALAEAGLIDEKPEQGGGHMR